MKRSEIRGRLAAMVRYRRNFVPGGTFFFTLTLDDRRSSVLVDHVALLRAAFRKTRGAQPFALDAVVGLPDHLHAIMTLPPGDSDFSGRWRRIKAAFTRSVVAAGVPVPRDHRGEYGLWQKRFGNTPFGMTAISNAALTIFISTPSNIDWCAWPFSSLHRYARAGVLSRDWGGGGTADNANFGERED